MPSDRQMKRIILWLIIIIFISFSAAIVLFILSGDTWFTAAWIDDGFSLTGLLGYDILP
ncbi:MAG TPA: hypothetical protein PLG09_00240 [Syntrophomonadaceae bacterium]|jgi:hypothetical protein|nr:hypothetical protein [Syntrophomonadaceae bacterium]HOQ08534.1 hypothetical protein [Syntrophomonadaceae bacterium]HPU48990.1 hypothetical protein [Syntrophomonadaceae bacterium]